MRFQYREFATHPRLAPYVECFWEVLTTERHPEYPVLPDGCVDIVFSQPGAEPGALQVVGAMTRQQQFPLPAGHVVFGVRFRPGMSYGFLRAPGPLLTDRSLALHELWGSKGHRLYDQLAAAGPATQRIALLEAHLQGQPPPGVVQKACSWIVENRGMAGIDEIVTHTGLSSRHFRRLCLEQAGLTPKHLCRVIRFRHALSKARSAGRRDWAQLALDCGYYDQAHLIRDFREFSGSTPAEYGRFFQSRNGLSR